jgi:hypothetical protein
MSLGNMRPAPLKLVETAIWKLFLGAAAGLDRRNEIQKFLDAVSEVRSLDRETLGSDYFFKCEHHILIHLWPHINRFAQMTSITFRHIY